MSFFTEKHHPKAFNQLTVRNSFRQILYLNDATELIISYVPTIKLYASLIRDLNYLAVCGVNNNPGRYRKKPVKINGSTHQPPNFEQVPDLIGELYGFVSEQWDNYDAFDLAAYTLWRITWIHPFEDGNGRTANAIAFYILCMKHGFWLPGEKNIPNYWRENNDNRYYRALAVADNAGKNNPDASAELSDLLRKALMNQLKSAKLD